MNDTSHALPSKAHAICAYAEPLAAERRVLVVGDASLDLGGRLAAAGARVVHVYDPDADRARAARTPRGVTVRALPEGDFDVRDGAFDLAIVPEMSAIKDPAALLGRLRRIVGSEGAVLVAARNPESMPAGARGVDYTDLFDLVALQFANVRMIAQVPFVGVTLAELGDAEDEPEVAVDTQLVTEPGVPEVFLALGSQRDVRLGAYTIVQLPAEEKTAASTISAAHAADDAAVHAALAEAQLRADLLYAQLEEQRAVSIRAAAEGDRARKSDDSTVAKLKESETRASDHYVRAERLTHDIRKLEEELARQRDRVARLTKEQEAAQKAVRSAEDATAANEARVHDAERAVALRDQQLAILAAEFEAVRAALDVPQVDPDAVQRLAERADAAEATIALLELDLASVGEVHVQELVALEARLQERARVVQAHEMEIARRERLVRELVSAIEEQHLVPAASVAAVAAPNGGGANALAAQENALLREKLDKLALHVARREADLQSQAWRVAELEHQSRGAPAPAAAAARTAPASDDLEKQLSNARAELDALRQALAQEHAARGRAESGDELAKARAELARQAVLIEQLSRELEARDRSRAAPAEGNP